MLWTLTDSWFESTQAHLPIWWPWSARSRPQHQCRTREAKKCTSCVPAPIAEAICMQLKREPDLRAYIARFACARLCKCCTVDKFQSVTRRRCRAHVIVLTASNDVVCSGRRRCVQSGRWVAWRVREGWWCFNYITCRSPRICTAAVHYTSTSRELSRKYKYCRVF